MGPSSADAAPGAGRTALEVRLLGTPQLRLHGVERPFPSGRPGRLLAALLLARDHPVSTDRLVDDVWGTDLPADARAALHTTVGRLRRALGAEGARVVREPNGYRLDGTGLVMDADQFVERVAQAREADPATALQAYDEALALWRGEPWSGWPDDLARGDRLRLEEIRTAAREERVRVLLGEGRTAEAVAELRLLVAEQPLRDAPVQLLMEALHRQGDAAGALAAFAIHRRVLADELGLDPSAELVAAQQRVLERAPVTDPAPAAVEPTRTSADQARTELLGRAADLTQVARLVRLHRCVTLVGPGGVGKTALARASAPASAWWVDLSSVTTEAGVWSATAAALGVQVFPGGSPEAAFRRRLETTEGLLVLDNCEHVLGPAADLVEQILTTETRVRVLATSRERLGLAGEQVLPVTPLRLPAPGSTDVEVPAVALFLQRARSTSPDLTSDPSTLQEVNQLVHMLDGLPLAIELAASRVGVVSLSTLRQRLERQLDLLKSHRRRGPARHHTLVDTINWSYELLDEDQKRAFRWLSVFAGPFDLDAVEAVLGADQVDHVLDLVERSLLARPGPHAEDGRLRMLETLRAFARSRLPRQELDEAAAAHARWASDIAERAGALVQGPQESAGHRLVERWLAELGAATRWSLDSGTPAPAVSIVSHLYQWAYYRVRVDVLDWARRLVDTGDDGALTPEVLAAASSYWWMSGDQELARTLAERGVALGGGPDHPAAVHPLAALADQALAVGDLDRAHRDITRGLAHGTEELGATNMLIGAAGLVLARTFAGRSAVDELTSLRALPTRGANATSRAMARYAEGEALSDSAPELALKRFEEARALAGSVDNRLALGISLIAETALRGRVGKLDRATLQQTAQALEFWLGSGNENLFVTCLRNVVPLMDRLHEHETVVHLVASTTAHTPDRPPYGPEAERLEASLTAARRVVGTADFDSLWQAGSDLSLQEVARRAVAVLSRHQEAHPAV